MVMQNVSENTPNMLTASELANMLNVHINTVRRWSDEGILRVYRIGRRGDRRFLMEDVNDFLATNLQSGNTAQQHTA
jgi:excisionase family DNA binding protein